MLFKQMLKIIIIGIGYDYLSLKYDTLIALLNRV